MAYLRFLELQRLADIDALKEDIGKTQAMAETAAFDASAVREGLASFAKLQNDRLDRMRNVLDEEHKSIGAIYRELRETSEINQLEFSAISYMALELARFFKVHDDLQMLELGIEDLLHGQITPRLVAASTLREMIVEIAQKLEKRSIDLCVQTPNRSKFTQIRTLTSQERGAIFFLC